MSGTATSPSGVMQINRAERRRLKKALKLPFTPSAEFTAKYLEKMTQPQEPVKVRVKRAWDDNADEA